MYSKTCGKQTLSKRHKIGFQDQLSPNAGQKYCRKGSILQYCRPSLSYHISFKIFVLSFLSDRFTQVLLYLYFVSLVVLKLTCLKESNTII